jgi:hypothetical protein
MNGKIRPNKVVKKKGDGVTKNLHSLKNLDPKNLT